MDTLKRIEKVIRESAFHKKIKNRGLKFNPGLALTGVRTTGPRETNRKEKRSKGPVIIYRLGEGGRRILGGSLDFGKIKGRISRNVIRENPGNEVGISRSRDPKGGIAAVGISAVTWYWIAENFGRIQRGTRHKFAWEMKT